MLTKLIAVIISQYIHYQFSLCRVQLSVTPWTAAHQAALSVTNSWSLLKLMSIELVMPSNIHQIIMLYTLNLQCSIIVLFVQ